SIANLVKPFISTPYSIPSSFLNPSIKPITIISLPSSSEIPPLINYNTSSSHTFHTFASSSNEMLSFKISL
ncbi:hypothetical protein, partial [Bacillus pumilus]|uniref:hypothetical protein n=1 Tax=Bacillus pumilus TaxID=1408 RepID=UPI001C930D2D